MSMDHFGVLVLALDLSLCLSLVLHERILDNVV